MEQILDHTIITRLAIRAIGSGFITKFTAAISSVILATIVQSRNARRANKPATNPRFIVSGGVRRADVRLSDDGFDHLLSSHEK